MIPARLRPEPDGRGMVLLKLHGPVGCEQGLLRGDAPGHSIHRAAGGRSQSGPCVMQASCRFTL